MAQARAVMRFMSRRAASDIHTVCARCWNIRYLEAAGWRLEAEIFHMDRAVYFAPPLTRRKHQSRLDRTRLNRLNGSPSTNVVLLEEKVTSLTK